MKIMDELRAAFDGDDGPRKNIALRKAHAKISRLVAVSQMVVDAADAMLGDGEPAALAHSIAQLKLILALDASKARHYS